LSKSRSPIKGLGQNFLVDRSVIERILRTADISPDDRVLEIGPGRGALTGKLIESSGKTILVEYDHALASDLRRKYSANDRVTVIDGDILATDLSLLFAGDARWKVVANLPYNISTEVLFKLMEARTHLSSMVLMLQKEVGERLVAGPGGRDYGVTTVLFRLWFDIKLEFYVYPESFYPSPKIDSAVLSFSPLPVPRVDVVSSEIFSRLVKGAFSMRRKTLSNSLKSAFLAAPEVTSRIFSDCGIDGTRRGETLSLEEFAALSRAFAQREGK